MQFQSYLLLLIISALFCVACSNHVQDGNDISKIQSEEIEIPFFDVNINVDGTLNEAVYLDLQKLSLVRNQDGMEITEKAFRTEVQMFRNKQQLHISFTVFDTDIHSHYTERDEHLWKEECVEVFIDTDSIETNYVEIELSAANVLFDSYIVNPTEIDVPETARFDLTSIKHAVSIDGTLNNQDDVDLSWTAEMSIDLKELDQRFNPENSHWKINIYRIEENSTSAQYSALSPTFKNFHQPKSFLALTF